VVSVVSVFGGLMVVAVALALFSEKVPDRRVSPHVACLSNLKTLEGVKSVWALENSMSSNAVPTEADLVGPGKYISHPLKCLSGGTYTLGAVKDKPRCSVAGHTF
jgi:hypothetical protein